MTSDNKEAPLWQPLLVRPRLQTKYFAGLLLTLGLAAGLLAPAGPALAQPLADLSISKTDRPDPVVVGELLTYRLDVENQGPNTATNVVVTDALPPSTRLLDVPPGCSAAGNTITCTVGTLDIDDSFFVLFSVVPTEPGTIRNTATVSSATLDPNPSNNVDTAATTVIGPSASHHPRAEGVPQVSEQFEQEAGESGNVELGLEVSH